jgi:cyclopropane fatty-acyl-phospholipid synthase-like methyltransferase
MMASPIDIGVRCPSCGSGELRAFFELSGVPIRINFLCDTRQAALGSPRGDIRLVYCRGCGLISNAAFDAKRLEYGEGYENSLCYSAVFQRYAEAQADRLVETFGLEGKTILEIGCGDGRFLRMLCERGDNRGIGFDPSYVAPGDAPPKDDRVRIIKDLYSERYSDVEFDFVLSRQTLEHVQHPGDMLGPLRRSLADRLAVPVFFEVPNGLHTLRRLFVWDIIYEHTSYFTAPALQTTFARDGFRVEETFEAFDGQYLCVTAYPSREVLRTTVGRDAGARVEKHIDEFEANYRGYIDQWRKRLDTLALEGKSVVLWGGGSKGITFLNMFDLRDRIRQVVDVNPKKQGKYITGQGQRIVPAEYLVDHPADAVIVANPIYKDEIAAINADLGLAPEFLYL